METCEGCKWLEDNNTWCDMNRNRRSIDDARCSRYDDSKRRFEPKQFYCMCKEFVDCYDTFENKEFNDLNSLKPNVRFDYNATEFLSFILNDMKREIKYYKKYKLNEDLNQIYPIITQQK